MKELKVIKRDGRKVDFDNNKIYNAILSAFKDVDGNKKDFLSKGEITSFRITADIVNELVESNKNEFTVEEIQDMVENHLMDSERKDVCKAYILYRNERTKARSLNTEMMKDVLEKLFAKNVKNQNANVDEHSFGGRIGESSDVMLKKIALEVPGTMSEKAVYNHLNNIIYTHDLSSYIVGSHNCLSVPFDHLLKNGVKTRQTSIRGAKSVGTAFQLLAVFFQLQSLQQFGGVSATHLDWTMVPYVRHSFMKQYILEYLKRTDEFCSLDIINLYFDTYTDELGIVRDKFDDWLEENKSSCLEKLNLKEEDFRLNNKDNLDKTLYQAALFNVIIEVRQSVEAMYHNLNSLQSRSGNQLKMLAGFIEI